MENIQKLMCEMQKDFTCASKNSRTNAPIKRPHHSFSFIFLQIADELPGSCRG